MFIVYNYISHKIIKSIFNKKSCLCLRKQEQVEYQNFVFFLWDRLKNVKVMSNECYSILSGRPLTLHEHPLWLASRGWSSPAILPPQDWTENLTVNSPMLQPTEPMVDEISCQNVSIYAQVSQTIKGIQKFKI